MRNKLVLVSACCIILAVLFAFKPFPAKHAYQHMIIMARHYDMDHVFISIDGKEYSDQKRFKKESQGEWDMNPAINLIHQYEADGWELMNFNGSAEFNCFWLRREK